MELLKTKYTSLLMKKIGRNDPCHCGSGKKFKKCCESKMIRGRFLAAPLYQAPGASMEGKAMSLNSLFQAHVMQPRLTVAPSESKIAETTQTLEGKGDILISS